MPDAQDSRGLRPVGDDGGDTRWMTYAELGLARGINTASAKRLAARRKWRRQPGNDGTARVAVPLDEAMRRAGTPDDDARDNFTRLAADLEAALATLQEQLAFERDRADQAMDTVERTAARLAEAETQIGTLWSAAETAALLRDALETALTAEERTRRRLEAEVTAAQAAKAAAEARAETLRHAEQARRDRGWLARLLAGGRAGR
jgi:hypothetical protein